MNDVIRAISEADPIRPDTNYVAHTALFFYVASKGSTDRVTDRPTDRPALYIYVTLQKFPRPTLPLWHLINPLPIIICNFCMLCVLCLFASVCLTPCSCLSPSMSPYPTQPTSLPHTEVGKKLPAEDLSSWRLNSTTTSS